MVSHARVAVSHHHVVGVAGDQHGLRVDRGRELRHLGVGAWRRPVHVRAVHALHTQHVVAAPGGVQVGVSGLHRVVDVVAALEAYAGVQC